MVHNKKSPCQRGFHWGLSLFVTTVEFCYNESQWKLEEIVLFQGVMFKRGLQMGSSHWIYHKSTNILGMIFNYIHRQNLDKLMVEWCREVESRRYCFHVKTFFWVTSFCIKVMNKKFIMYCKVLRGFMVFIKILKILLYRSSKPKYFLIKKCFTQNLFIVIWIEDCKKLDQ